jgi:RimJ/RimL family protein N-acetyltransferase
LLLQYEAQKTRSSQQRHSLRVRLNANRVDVLGSYNQPIKRPMQIQTPGLLRNTSEQFIDSVDAQTLRRLQVSGAYDPSRGTLRHGQNSPAHPSGPSFHFRPLREDDLTVLHEWLLRPHVAAWWGPADSIDELRSDYLLSVDQSNATRAYIAHLDGKPIGFIQSYVVIECGGGWWESETDPGAQGIDQFLAEADQLGRGLGCAMIRAFVGRLFAGPGATVVQTDPDPRNERAIRAATLTAC